MSNELNPIATFPVDGLTRPATLYTDRSLDERDAVLALSADDLGTRYYVEVSAYEARIAGAALAAADDGALDELIDRLTRVPQPEPAGTDVVAHIVRRRTRREDVRAGDRIDVDYLAAKDRELRQYRDVVVLKADYSSGSVWDLLILDPIDDEPRRLSFGRMVPSSLRRYDRIEVA